MLGQNAQGVKYFVIAKYKNILKFLNIKSKIERGNIISIKNTNFAYIEQKNIYRRINLFNNGGINRCQENEVNGEIR